MNGGYDDGYQAVPCLWGTAPGSLVAHFLTTSPVSVGSRVLDIGCGEGKNAAPFAQAGCEVCALDCSPAAIGNGKRAFPDAPIEWREEDVLRTDFGHDAFDLIISYGLFHCLPSEGHIREVISRLRRATRPGGANIVCAFNNRSHDLSAHPHFQPTLLRHEWYLERYSGWDLALDSDSDIHEVHPHNNLPHHHSLTRFVARRPS